MIGHSWEPPLLSLVTHPLSFAGVSPVAGSDLGSSLGGLAGFEDEKRRWRGFGRAELSCAV